MPLIPISNYFFQVAFAGENSYFYFILNDFLYLQGDHVWVDQRTHSEFNVEIGARVVASQAGQIVLIDDNGQVKFIYWFFLVLIKSL